MPNSETVHPAEGLASVAVNRFIRGNKRIAEGAMKNVVALVVAFAGIIKIADALKLPVVAAAEEEDAFSANGFDCILTQNEHKEGYTSQTYNTLECSTEFESICKSVMRFLLNRAYVGGKPGSLDDDEKGIIKCLIEFLGKIPKALKEHNQTELCDPYGKQPSTNLNDQSTYQYMPLNATSVWPSGKVTESFYGSLSIFTDTNGSQNQSRSINKLLSDEIDQKSLEGECLTFKGRSYWMYLLLIFAIAPLFYCYQEISRRRMNQQRYRRRMESVQRDQQQVENELRDQQQNNNTDYQTEENNISVSVLQALSDKKIIVVQGPTDNQKLWQNAVSIGVIKQEDFKVADQEDFKVADELVDNDNPPMLTVGVGAINSSESSYSYSGTSTRNKGKAAVEEDIEPMPVAGPATLDNVKRQLTRLESTTSSLHFSISS